ncbi:MAG TPA: hypothetical protein VGU02_03010 [Gaiellaceae bacterium]|nr:hypothetical protein [Gaiellaceae bacterium]
MRSIRSRDLSGSSRRRDGIKTLALTALVLVLVVAGAARGVGCSPLNCSPSQFALGGGTMLGVRTTLDSPLRVIDLRTGHTKWWLPAGIVSGSTLVHQDGSLITWWNAARGARTASVVAQEHGAFALTGVSQDGGRAVLARTQSRSTTFLIVSPGAQRMVKLGGRNWQFDALNGHSLFLIHQLRAGYTVRLYDLAANKLQARALKDPRDGALIQGLPTQRVSSPNGRYLFTLYIDGNGNAMIHELDTVAGAAHCIDLAGKGDFNSAMTWAAVPSRDNSTLWAVSVGYGRIVAIDVASHVVRRHASFYSIPFNANAGVAALAPDGRSIAVTDAQHTWFASLKTLAVKRGPNHVAIALAFSPDGHRVWGIGLRSKVFSLRVNR